MGKIGGRKGSKIKGYEWERKSWKNWGERDGWREGREGNGDWNGIKRGGLIGRKYEEKGGVEFNWWKNWRGWGKNNEYGRFWEIGWE